jgi:Na+-transporting methylmalonyl-CoA/oxaloacetate decarboxylase gamma subunit
MKISVPPDPTTAPRSWRRRLAPLLLCPLALAPSRLLALPEHPKLGESLVYQFNGLVVVFIALGMIWVMMEIMGAIFRRVAVNQAARAAALPKVAAPEPAAPAPAPAAAAVATDGVDPATYAAIVAAVYCTLGKGHRVVGVTSVIDARDWSREGRRDHFSSHRVR